MGELVQVEFTPEFKRNLRALARKYRHIRSDLRLVVKLPSDPIHIHASPIT